MKHFFQSLCTVSALSLSAVTADAASLTITNISGVWDSWTGGTAVTTGNSGSTAQLRWGIPTDGGKSGYDFTPTTTPTTEAAHTPFTLGTFTHLNYPIQAGSAITSATLTVVFDFFLGSDSSTVYQRSSTFVFDHWETGNSDRPCANGGTVGVGVNVNGCADRVVASTNPALTETFTVVEGDTTSTYVFAVDGFDIGDQFWTKENQSNTASLKAQFTYESVIQPAPVPLPAAAWMLVAGLGALGVAGRRRRT
ncbi:THxN family PEP-CTERM protein [Paracoccus sp. SSK6]|uniref:THxN family PEP-CTERM protein n=1 Tax=Paracoccus sp. SSK6 TaxID=3143131 RepID=UPI00321B4200